jgi:hypothetical protein
MFRRLWKLSPVRVFYINLHRWVSIRFCLPVEPDSGIVIAWLSFKVINQHWFSFLVIMAFNSHTELLPELKVRVTPLNLP